MTDAGQQVREAIALHRTSIDAARDTANALADERDKRAEDAGAESTGTATVPASDN